VEVPNVVGGAATGQPQPTSNRCSAWRWTTPSRSGGDQEAALAGEDFAQLAAAESASASKANGG